MQTLDKLIIKKEHRTGIDILTDKIDTDRLMLYEIGKKLKVR